MKAAGAAPIVRVGVPLMGGRLVAAAREQRLPVLFSANAFARLYPKGHEREGYFKVFARPDPAQFAGLDAALDSAGFVAAARYGDFRWSVAEYYDLVASHPWTWHASMDYACEPEVAADRPLRLLRIAATASLLGQCQREAASRGLPPPMPVLQGWKPAEYALCAEWFAMREWPDLVGIGSVCRRHLHGSIGIASVLEAVDSILPPNVRVHLFGVKNAALASLAHHPRLASIDSMAWDAAARAERRTGRDMAFRIQHMQSWAERQQRIAASALHGAGVQTSLFDPTAFGGFSTLDEAVLEALALVYADLVMGGELEYLDAVCHCARDGVVAIAMLRQRGWSIDLAREFDDMIDGFGSRVADALSAS